MKQIMVDISGEDYPDCPFRTDLNSCSAIVNSEINSCPKANDYPLNMWSVNEKCPLKEDGVCVIAKKQV